MSSDHKLSAILFADIAGYTAMMQKNEQDSLKLLERFKNVLEKITPEYKGKIVQYFGDGCILAFDSATAAVEGAIALQNTFKESPAIPVRIGLHLGDVIFTNENVYGDGVNIASRIESLGIPGAILMSKSVRDHIKNQIEFVLVEIGSFDLKNVDEPMKVFALANPGFIVPKRGQMKGKLKQKKRKPGILALLMMLVILILSAFLVTYFLTEKKIKSIAVLAFDDLSPAQDQEYLGEGIATSIHSLLSRFKELKVIGLKSSFSFKDTKTDLVTIGKSLNVKFILEGNVQRIGDYIKIYVALINANDGTQRWSEAYNVKSTDPFNVQDKIAQSVIAKINMELTDKEKEMLVSSATTTSLNYEDYMKGQYYLYKLTQPGIDSASYYFNLVLQRDSNFARGHAALADLWVIKMQQYLVDFTEGEKRVEVAARKAHKLDSTLAEVHYSLGLSAWAQWNWQSLVEELYEAIQIEPNHALAHIYLSNFQYILGKPTESKFHSRKALELEPLDPLFNALYSMNLMYAGQKETAVQILENNLKKNPDDEQTITTLRTAYHLVDRYDDAYTAWKKSFSLKKDKLSDSVFTKGYHEGGYYKALQRLAEYYASESKRAWSIATLYTRAGMKEKAIEWLYKAIDEHDLNMPYLKVDPIFEFLKNDKRYKDLLKKIGLNN